MSGVFTRLKGAATQAASKSEPAPSKEDILTSIEQFTGEKTVRSPKENNNNTKRRDSHDRENVDPNDPTNWEVVDTVNERNTVPTGHPHSYSMEWERHFNRPNYLRWIRQQAVAGELRPCRFRSICWRLFLEVLPEDMNGWSEKAHQERCKYEALKNKLIVNPRIAVDSANVKINNPLSQDEESPWNKFFQDNELRLTIKQDVIRTFPEIAFFRDPLMQESLVDVLFTYCRENQGISYKQGMHELLAPIIFVLHYDHQAFLHASETDNVLPIIHEMLDPKYLEHDAYCMFCQVMATVEPWYLSKDICSAPKKKMDIFTSQPFTRPQELLPSSVIVTKLTRIQDYLIKKSDPELHAHLETLEIAPQIYGIRWLRLLFGREFPMQDLLMLWDAIFADGIGFELVDFIFAAMMLFIRDLLLASDYAGCLTSLMKFPQVSDAHYFIDKALWLREPSQYPRPPNYSHQVTSRLQQSSLKTKQVSPPSNKRGSTASLSQVEDSMYRQRGHSSASLGRLDPAYLRSSQSSPAGYSPVGFSPDEIEVSTAQSSPTKFGSLPTRGNKKSRKASKHEHELQHQVSSALGQLNDKEAMCRYCASKLDIHIGHLQAEISRQHMDGNEEITVALAGIKLVRDILSGTLRFTRNIVDDDGEMHMNDNYYSPDSDMNDPVSSGGHRGEATSKNAAFSSHSSKDRRRRMFYMSSGDTSSAAESPESFNGVVPPHLSDVSSNADYELGDVTKRHHPSFSGTKGGYSAALPEEKWSGVTELSSQASSYGSGACGAVGGGGDIEVMEESPNPLYRKEWAEDAA